MAETIVYIDGFNLYHRVLKDAPQHRWLDLERFCQALLPSTATITKIKYYTSRVSSKIDPDAPAKQQVYLNALTTLPLVEIHYGNFLVKKKYARLTQTPRFRPEPVVVEIFKMEEKGTDVKLATHLVRDAFTNAFQEAAVLTNDTDLVEPIRIVTEELGKSVTLLSPVGRPAQTLAY